MTLPNRPPEAQGETLCPDPDCGLPFTRFTARQIYCKRAKCQSNRDRKRATKNRVLKPPRKYICRHCQIEREFDHGGPLPIFCRQTPECVGARKKHQNKYLAQYRQERGYGFRGMPKPEKLWTCQRCGHMSTGRINCPECHTILSDQCAEINGVLPS